MSKRGKPKGADAVPVINEAGEITDAVASRKAPRLARGEVAPAVAPTLSDTGDRVVRHASCEQETIVPRAVRDSGVYCGYCRDSFPVSAFEVVRAVHA